MNALVLRCAEKMGETTSCTVVATFRRDLEIRVL